MKHWISRITGIATFPALTWFAIQGSEVAANLLPFAAWLLFALSLIVVLMVASLAESKPDVIVAASEALSPIWFRRIDIAVDCATIAALAAHGWYGTAIAVILGSFAMSVYRHSVATEAAKITRTTELA